ncbi:MAG: hypothetical protein MUO26_00715 [Methanotrichaceae archaeon]|nr:hypothetical protein [Methanotrichaceae archaeon]
MLGKLGMISKNYIAWDVQESDFPGGISTEDQLRFLLRYAILAPSGPNNQPWKFAINTSTISVYADLRRSLPFVDPSNRTLYTSIGCALANLLIAGEHFGFNYKLDFFPNGLESNLVADVKFKKSGTTVGEDLFPQITRRFTVKDNYLEKDLDELVLQDLQDFIDVPRFYLYYMTDPASKSAISDLVSRAHRIQLADKDFRRNLGDWLRTNWTTEPDGMPLYTFGVPDPVSLGFPAAFREFDLSKVVVYRDSGLIHGCAALAVFSSDADDKLAWVRSGILLENFFLKATKYDIRLSFFSQPIGHPLLREELTTMIQKGYPQLLFSLGYSESKRHTPRRNVDDVLLEESS